MKKSLIVASALVLGSTGSAFAAGDETGGGVTTPDSSYTTSTYSQAATTPDRRTEMTLLEYFLQLIGYEEESL